METLKEQQLEIGQQIRVKRKEQNLTQDALAEAVGITSKHLGNIENGKANPSFILMKNIAKSINISLDDFPYPVTETAKSNATEMIKWYDLCPEDVQRLILAATRALAKEWHDIVQEKASDEQTEQFP